jgi:hypothetical protein
MKHNSTGWKHCRPGQAGSLSSVRRRLHELDGCPIGIANVDNALPGIRACFQDLRLANRVPTGRCNGPQHGIKIIHRKGNMHRSDIARPDIDALSVRRGMVLEQLDFVAVTFEYGERYLGTRHTGDFTGEITSMMGPMRKLEAENVLPEGERPLKVRDRETGVIGGDDVKRPCAHQIFSSKRPTPNVQQPALSEAQRSRMGPTPNSEDAMKLEG